ncbi:hypothetical protein AX774_g5603 [Zancudomyces culisetae]|uniref:Uncharacterized protein n=1 Tax=Zancudomyces culisetae TaxID=1213189 RepID=A0A1R1PJ05_ZANCU|nr:hypothetical protein AX774_g5603 [Zancudomyces culisetae]|eukprot:OMH80950.1 hypothetical protein AX774_g5603 [Zancudomyces culisetae]
MSEISGNSSDKTYSELVQELTRATLELLRKGVVASEQPKAEAEVILAQEKQRYQEVRNKLLKKIDSDTHGGENGLEDVDMMQVDENQEKYSELKKASSLRNTYILIKKHILLDKKKRKADI